MAERSYLSIGQVLELLKQEFPDLTISKIRFLESQGLLDPERTPSGYRKFYEPDIDRLRFILRAQTEQYLPLKVIKGRLGGDGGEDFEGAEGDEGDAVGRDSWATASVGAPALAGPGRPATAGGAAPGLTPGVAASHPAAGLRDTGPRDPDLATVGQSGPLGASTALGGSGGLGGLGTATSGDPGGATPPRLGVVGRRPGDNGRAASAGTSRSPAGGSGGLGERDEAPDLADQESFAIDSIDDSLSADDVSLTLDELAEASGLSPAQVTELERFGMVAGRRIAGTTYYDGDCLEIASVAAGFRRFGVEARHLRMYKTAVEREAGFFEQVVTPMLKQRNPKARRQAVDTLVQLSRLGHQLRAAALRQALRDYTGGS